MSAKIKYLDSLVNHLLAQKTPAEMEAVLLELLSRSELTEVANRLQIFALLAEGVPQRQIAEQLGVAIATVTRGSNVMKKRAG